MIVCDQGHLKELKSRMKAARKLLPDDVAGVIDAEIEAIEAQGDPWYSSTVIASAFRLLPAAEWGRLYKGNPAFQGHLPHLADTRIRYGDWFAACAVNKDTLQYRTWVNPDDAIKALQVAHRLQRYSKLDYRQEQVRIDKWRLKHGTEAVPA